MNDCIQDCINFFENCAICEPKSSNPFFVKFKISVQIGGFAEINRVARPIQFDRKLCFGAEEIQIPIAYRMLAPKLYSSNLSVS